MERIKAQKNQREVLIKAGNIVLGGYLTVPENAAGIVIFAHGSGSGRHSPRNQYVSGELNKAGMATLLFDLLTTEEEGIDMVTAELRFDIPLLSKRLVAATDWVKQNDEINKLDIGYYGASTGSAVALIASVERSTIVGAVVSRGGRPDLAESYLPRVKAPTLLIVGGEDYVVIDLNKKALSEITAEKKLEIVPGATHLFEEPGTLEQVAKLASRWFTNHLKRIEKRSK
jgi:putative phosphoribosyl transferase